MSVVETTTFRLRDGTGAEHLALLDAAAEREAVELLPGYVAGSRRTSLADDGLVTVAAEWESAGAASAAASVRRVAHEALLALAVPSTSATTRATRLLVDGAAARNARGLYLDGIRDGHVRDAVTRRTGSRYTQHSTGVRDGVEGFVAFFEPFVAAHSSRDIDLVRTLEDGRFVFVHAYQRIDGGAAEWVTTDLFDTDADGKVVEHWDVIAPYVGAGPSGRTQVDGPVEVVDLDRTETNKAVVAAFLEQVVAGGDRAAVDHLVATTVVEHDPAVHREAEPNLLRRDYRRVHRLIGQGCFVVALSQAVQDGTLVAVFDLFRVEDGRVVEHWDNSEPVLAEDVNGGKF